MSLLLPLDVWVPIVDGDPCAAAMYNRHYSSARSRARRELRGTLQIMGPCERLVLMTPCRRGLFAWRRQQIRDDGQAGVECSIFRNEGAGLSSSLIIAADVLAYRRWPGLRHFTYVDPKHVSNSNAGRCFQRAGWCYVYVRDENRQRRRKCSSRGLFLMERSA